MKSAAYWIEHLQLKEHPEGGFYKETYRAPEAILQDGLPSRFSGARSFSTAIYYLLRSEDRSLFHRIKSDEVWHFYAGSALSIYVLNNEKADILTLGPNVDQGESLQVVIPANVWFGAKVTVSNAYALAGCTVAPGFDFNDFELAKREKLLSEFPQHSPLIELLTRKQ